MLVNNEARTYGGSQLPFWFRGALKIPFLPVFFEVHILASLTE
jgi:hypothetical protein